PSICTIYDIGETEDGRLFIAMALYEGETLAAVLKNGPLQIDRALSITRQIADGLSHAHEAGIVHRDIKPANIMIARGEQVKILDFGVAKLEASPGLTRTGSTVGTMAYMSPEQARGEPVDHRTDIWSLGVVMYEMLSGVRPFRGSYDAAVLYTLLNESHPPLATIARSVPGSLEHIVDRALAKDANQRVQSMAGLLAELESLATHDSAEVRRPANQTRRLPRRTWLIGTVLAAAVVILAAVWLSRTDTPDTSIAVLPFQNINQDPGAQPFASGMHDGVLTELSRISGLTVISRTSVARYDGTDKNLPTIASELGVSNILAGSVQSAGERVRVSVQLIEADRDRNLWAENYDRRLSASNIFRIQTELAREIAERLEAELTPEERGAVRQTPTEDLEAYRLYMQGRAQMDRRSEEGMRTAVARFETAIERDPNYDLAWVGLADALRLLHSYGHEQAEDVLPRSEAALRRALELYPEMAEAHASLGMLHEARHYGPEALRHLRRALEIRPGYAEPHHWLSWLHRLLGNPEAAIESSLRAVELNPLSLEAVANLSFSYMETGQFQKAHVEARRLRELEPEWATASLIEGMSLYYLGRLSEAEEALDNLTVAWAPGGGLGALGLVHLAAGDTAGTERVLASLRALADPFNEGLVLAAQGNLDEAFQRFEQVERWNDYWPTFVVRYHFRDILNPLRDDPRYEDILAAINTSWGLEEDGTLPSCQECP
ncbi:MAG: protein kinase, partial [Rhodothermales bacterium]|nr:protein kinase [Rhodothermales bacterium]